MYSDIENTDFDMTFVDAKAKELGDKVKEKLSRALGGYFSDETRAEADAKAMEHESLTNQKISLLKERKTIREQLKAMPDNEALLAELENSKAQENEFVPIIREAKKAAEDSAWQADSAASVVGKDLSEYGPKFETMQKYMTAQRVASGEMHS